MKIFLCIIIILLSSCSEQQRLEKLEKENKELIAKVARLETKNEILEKELNNFKKTKPQPIGSQKSNFLIVPGVSFGEVIIGKPIPSSFLDKMGKPDRNEVIPPTTYAWGTNPEFYDVYDLMIKTNKVGNILEVGAIYSRLKDYKTKKGIGPGSKMKEAQKFYPTGSLEDGIDGKCWITDNISFCSFDGKPKEISTIIMGDGGI